MVIFWSSCIALWDEILFFFEWMFNEKTNHKLWVCVSVCVCSLFIAHFHHHHGSQNRKDSQQQKQQHTNVIFVCAAVVHSDSLDVISNFCWHFWNFLSFLFQFQINQQQQQQNNHHQSGWIEENEKKYIDYKRISQM